MDGTVRLSTAGVRSGSWRLAAGSSCWQRQQQRMQQRTREAVVGRQLGLGLDGLSSMVKNQYLEQDYEYVNHDERDTAARGGEEMTAGEARRETQSGKIRHRC
jgi:hypothetical protein